MGVPSTNPVPSQPPASRGTQYAVVGMAAVCFLLLGFRWSNERWNPRPTECVQVAHRVELNRATRSELMQLPGIGPTRADKILAYRESVGNFQSVDDLRSVGGIGDLTLQRLKPFIHVDADEDSVDEPARLTRKPAPTAKSTKPIAEKTGKAGSKKAVPTEPIDINKASAVDLQQLPGVGPAFAKNIIEQREKQPFTKVDDLRKVKGIGAKRMEDIRPYVVVSE